MIMARRISDIPMNSSNHFRMPSEWCYFQPSQTRMHSAEQGMHNGTSNTPWWINFFLCATPLSSKKSQLPHVAGTQDEPNLSLVVKVWLKTEASSTYKHRLLNISVLLLYIIIIVTSTIELSCGQPSDYILCMR